MEGISLGVVESLGKSGINGWKTPGVDGFRIRATPRQKLRRGNTRADRAVICQETRRGLRLGRHKGDQRYGGW